MTNKLIDELEACIESNCKACYLCGDMAKVISRHKAQPKADCKNCMTIAPGHTIRVTDKGFCMDCGRFVTEILSQPKAEHGDEGLREEVLLLYSQGMGTKIGADFFRRGLEYILSRHPAKPEQDDKQGK